MRSKALRLAPLWALLLLMVTPVLAAAQDAPTTEELATSVGQLVTAVDSVWVAVAAAFVLLMQAGFALLEVGLSRMKNAGAVMGKILINMSIAILMFWATGFALAFGNGNDFWGTAGWFFSSTGFPTSESYVYSANTGEHLEPLVLPGGLLRRVARDRVRVDARPDQVRRVHPLRDSVRRLHLPRRRPLDVGRWLALQGRVPGLRRFLDRPPAGRPRCTHGRTHPRATHRQVPERQADPDPGSLHPARDHGHHRPVVRLDGLSTAAPASSRTTWTSPTSS